jgi:hypothetical protein
MFSIKPLLIKNPSGQIDESSSGLNIHEEIHEKITVHLKVLISCCWLFLFLLQELLKKCGMPVFKCK